MKTAAYLALIGAVSATQLLSEADHEFMKFVAEYGKSYGTKEEFEFRAALFKEHYEFIQEHNSQNGSFSVGVNTFADMTAAEKKKFTSGFKKSGAKKNIVRQTVKDLPDEVNWVEAGAISTVKNQGQCGSCWAFSSVGAMEAAYFLESGKLVDLSEQQLVDCANQSTGFDSQGCEGGEMDDAFRYASTYGMESAGDYPYHAKDGTCMYEESKVIYRPPGYADVNPDSVDDLKIAVAQQPVAVAIEADKLAFQFYRNGVFDDTKCGTNLDHGVLIAGYGTENGKDYWLVKNSWGATWGEKGYIKILRSSCDSGKGICGIQMEPSYPFE